MIRLDKNPKILNKIQDNEGGTVPQITDIFIETVNMTGFAEDD
ncbi:MULTISPECIES: hypothetical protein [unclassified Clostridium]|nr:MULTISPECIES: hypothetical protein [unclassified Clostridium]